MPIISVEIIKTKDKREIQKTTKVKKKQKQSVSKTVKDPDNQRRDDENKR